MSDEEKLELPSLIGLPVHERLLLEKYFHMVVNKNGWKKPINALIHVTVDEIPMIKRSIAAFTGSREIEIIEENPGEYRVSAEGYYNALGD